MTHMTFPAADLSVLRIAAQLAPVAYPSDRSSLRSGGFFISRIIT
jgi:hypothetical protein